MWQVYMPPNKKPRNSHPGANYEKVNLLLFLFVIEFLGDHLAL